MFENQLLKPRINWKNLCIVFSILFFIVGFCSAKIFANGVNKAGVISGTGPETIVYNVDNNPQVNPNYNEELTQIYKNSQNIQNQVNWEYIKSIGLQPATPLIPSTQKANNIIITAVAQITEGGTTVTPNAYYQILPVTHYNLVITYNSPIDCFATFNLTYIQNGQTLNDTIVEPIKAGMNTITRYNWKPKTTWSAQGTPINYDIQNVVCNTVIPAVAR